MRGTVFSYTRIYGVRGKVTCYTSEVAKISRNSVTFYVSNVQQGCCTPRFDRSDLGRFGLSSVIRRKKPWRCGWG